MADRGAPLPLTNYLVNPSFEDGNPPSFPMLTTYSGWTRGWGMAKSSAGDTVIVSRNTSVVDTAYGGSASARVSKAGTAGTAKIFQVCPTRINRRFFNRQCTLGIRVACDTVGIARPVYVDGGVYKFGTMLNTRNDLTWETLYVTLPFGFHSGNSIGVGMDMPGGSGIVYVDNAFLVDGPLPPSAFQFSCPIGGNSLSIGDGLGIAEPKCFKTMSGTLVLAAGTGAAVPYSVNEVDTDSMGLTANRITIKTDGRYFVAWGLLSTGASAPCQYYTTLYRVGAGTIYHNTSNWPLPWQAGYSNGLAYVAKCGSVVEDLIVGDVLEVAANCYTGGTITFHPADSFFQALRIGD